MSFFSANDFITKFDLRKCMTEKCTQCANEIAKIPYKPMDEWKVDGPLCGECYSSKLEEFYPGDHIRVNRLNESD